MIDLVLPEERFGFAAALMQMHRHRKQVFVDRLGWQLPSDGSWLEIDSFDDDHAVYLLARSADGEHEGSVRLLPSTRPHMLGTLFAPLCHGMVPVGPTCWEVSRLLSRPQDCAGTSILRIHRLLAVALVEFALLNGIDRYTVVAEPHRVPALLSVGWTVVPLGLPARLGGQLLQALLIEIDEATLPRMRERLRLPEPVLRAGPPAGMVS